VKIVALPEWFSGSFGGPLSAPSADPAPLVASGTASAERPLRGAVQRRMRTDSGRPPAEELRRRAADYRLLALDCVAPEGIDLLLMMAEVHEDEAAAAQEEEAERIIVGPPTSA
jgi:hypothetical protein